MSGEAATVEPIPLQVPVSIIADMFVTCAEGHAVLQVDVPDLTLLFTACAHPAPTSRDVEAARVLADGTRRFADDVARLADGA